MSGLFNFTNLKHPLGFPAFGGVVERKYDWWKEEYNVTTNQIAYQNYLETRRANQAREQETARSNLAKEYETKRSNIAQENISYGELSEKVRHNTASEVVDNINAASRQTSAYASAQDAATRKWSAEQSKSQRDRELDQKDAGLVLDAIKTGGQVVGNLINAGLSGAGFATSSTGKLK